MAVDWRLDRQHRAVRQTPIMNSDVIRSLRKPVVFQFPFSGPQSSVDFQSRSLLPAKMRRIRLCGSSPTSAEQRLGGRRRVFSVYIMHLHTGREKHH